ncbi:hypothetical protein DSO57_1028971 [Entomophthora muscae]|uniref:Uncharacterized protein n=1 Tax=Entomophthora muscae TaxID=34485 RepID=A0ACC2TP56_9FUNG|nr:hypothetical protein DSO57_1028971 [Entomophthora muscae]
MYASQPTGRRSISHKRIIESVLPDELVVQIRTTEFDDILNNGFPDLPFFAKSNHVISTLKLTLTPSIARDNSLSRYSCSNLHYYPDYFYVSYTADSASVSQI